MIKSENGRLRSYVQASVRDRDEVGFVEEAQRAVEQKVKLPTGMYIEWSGQFEHQVRARKTLQLVFPAVIGVIVLILYLTYHSVVDTLLVMTSVLGALAGGAIFQWLFGFHFSVAVWVGYIACFGMAVETGVVMLVYLREAIEERGGLARITSIADLRQAILEGAVHRLRPKLLTEGAAILSIAPMLWATGVGAEVIRPMAAPVLGGLLVADEVIDVFLPVLYFVVQKARWSKLRIPIRTAQARWSKARFQRRSDRPAERAARVIPRELPEFRCAEIPGQILTADSVQQQPIAAPGGSEINHGIHRNPRKRESESTSPFRVLPGGGPTPAGWGAPPVGWGRSVVTRL